MSIYSYDQALPPLDLLKLCDKMYPIGEDNAKEDTEKASKKSHNYQADSIEDMTSGKGVIDLHDQKTKQRLFNAIDAIVSGDDFALDDEYFEPAEKVDTSSPAYQVMDQCLAQIQSKLHTSLEMLRLQAGKCNELA